MFNDRKEAGITLIEGGVIVYGTRISFPAAELPKYPTKD
jgi:hypothetical protein